MWNIVVVLGLYLSKTIYPTFLFRNLRSETYQNFQYPLSRFQRSWWLEWAYVFHCWVVKMGRWSWLSPSKIHYRTTTVAINSQNNWSDSPRWFNPPVLETQKLRFNVNNSISCYMFRLMRNLFESHC